MKEILLALNFMHLQNLAHRDLKPDNILVDFKTKRLVLIDWGLADYFEPGKELTADVFTR